MTPFAESTWTAIAVSPTPNAIVWANIPAIRNSR